MAWYYWCDSATTSSSGKTWESWNSSTYDATTTSTACDCWESWNTSTTNTTTTDSSEVTWIRWNDVQTERVIATPAFEINKEAKAVAAANRERMEREAEERRKQAEAAELKASELLLDLIGQEQMDVFKETGRLLVKGRKFDYLIHKSGKVQRIEKDKVVDLCIHVAHSYDLPKTDKVIGLGLAAKADEKRFNKEANRIRSIGKNEFHMPEAAAM